MREAGLVDVDWFGMSGGIVVIHTGTVVRRRRKPSAGLAAPAPDIGSGATSTFSSASSAESRLGQRRHLRVGLTGEEVRHLAGIAPAALAPLVAEAAGDVVELTEAILVLDVQPATIGVVGRACAATRRPGDRHRGDGVQHGLATVREWLVGRAARRS